MAKAKEQSAPGVDRVALIETMVRLNEKARREGLLSLEEDVAGLPHPLLQQGIVEVVDGTPPSEIAPIMDLQIEEMGERLARERHDTLVAMRLIRDGVLAIQRGVPPGLLRALLQARVSPEERARLGELFRIPAPRRPRSPRPPAPGVKPEELDGFTFEDLLKLSDRDMIPVVRHIERKDIVLALRGASEAVRQKVLAGMSARVANQTLEEMRDMGPQKISVVEEAQRKIVALVRRLVEANEIGRPSRGAQP